MTDVLKIAVDRREELREEVARIDEFIRIAEILLNDARPLEERPELSARDLGLPPEVQDGFREPPTLMPHEIATGKAAGVSAGITRMNLMRRGPATANGRGAGGA